LFIQERNGNHKIASCIGPWCLPGARFDVVICEQALEQLGNEELQFAPPEINRVLKPGREQHLA
jgi:hypothetical protein